MSHQCHDEHDHSHSHGDGDGVHDHSDDITPALQHSLYQQIDFDGITTLNEAEPDSGKAVVKKTWAERMEESPEVESDVDEQLLMCIPFTAQVKLHSLLLRTSSAPSAPRTLHLFANRRDLDFSHASELPPTQTLELSQTSEIQEIPVKRALFGKCQSLTLFFEDNFSQGEEEVSRVAYVGCKGEWMKLGMAPQGLMYESAANPADHTVKGTASLGMGSRLGGGK